MTNVSSDCKLLKSGSRSVDAAVAVLSKTDEKFSLKDDQKTAPEAFLDS